ncbi:MAG: hypothetical protein HFH32_05845 [Eubacterium sp.]|nr:hypothetical protein [Eubacterium sp.]
MKWKQALACALVFAVLAGGYGWLKNRSSMQKVESGTGVDDELTEEELQAVAAAVELENETNGLKEYIENSVLMQIDPYHKNKAVLLYSVDGAQRRELQQIIESYLTFIVNGGVADALKESGKGEWDMDKPYIAEVLSAYQRTYTSPYQITVDKSFEEAPVAEALFYVEIIGKNAEMADNLALDMQQVLQKHHETVERKAGNHKLELLGSEINAVSDNGLQTLQHDKKAALTANLSSLKGMTESFTSGQMAVFEKFAGREIEHGKENINEAVTDSSPGFGMKYMFGGFAGGVLLYSCIFGCLYLFQNKVKSAEEIRRIYTFPFYGSISLKNNWKVQNRNQEKKQILNYLRIACKKRKITKLCAASGFFLNDQEKECLENMTEQLQLWGIDMVIAENAMADTSVSDVLANEGNVLMLCRIGTTTYQMVDEEMMFYLGNDIAVAGAVAFQ